MSASTDDGDRILAGFAARVTQLLGDDEEYLDSRLIAVLQKHDVIRMKAREDDQAKEQLLCEAARQRSGQSLGPLILFRTGEGPEAAFVRDLILSDEKSVRESAISRIERLRDDSCVSAVTENVLSRCRESIVSSRTGWHDAACLLADAVEQDWLLSLSGCRQSRALNFKEAWSEFVKHVLSPSAEAVRGCACGHLYPSINLTEIRANVARLTDPEIQDDEAVAEYLEQHGHIPLGPELSLGALMLARSEQEPDGEGRAALSELLKSDHPLHQYHACQALLRCGGQSAHVSQLGECFWSIVLWEGTKDRPRDARWRLLHILSRHFVHHLDVRMSCDDGEIIAATAWWLASRLFDVFSGSQESVHSTVDAIESQVAIGSALTWQLTANRRGPSRLKYLTLTGSPWAIALANSCPSPDGLAQLLDSDGPGTPDERLRAIFNLGVCSASLPRSSVSEYLLLGNEMADPTNTVLKNASDPELRAGLDAGGQTLISLDAQTPEQLLDGLLSKREPERQFVVHMLNVRVELGDVDPQGIWKLVTDRRWIDEVWQQLDLVTTTILGQAIITLACRCQPVWAPQLPHLFAEVAEARVDDAEARTVLLELVLRASCGLRTGSALRRLLNGKHAFEFRQLADTVQSTMAALLPDAGTWASSRLRSTLVDCCY